MYSFIPTVIDDESCIALTEHDTATGYIQLEAACIKEGIEGIEVWHSRMTDEELKKSPFYIEPLSTGTTEYFFREIKTGKAAR